MNLKYRHLFTAILLLFLQQSGFAQTATLSGILLDALNNPIENASIQANQTGSTSNLNGFYALEIPANKNVTITFSHINYKSVRVIFNLKTDEIFEFNPVLKLDIEQIETIVNDIDIRKKYGIYDVASVFLKAHKWDEMPHGSSRWTKDEIAIICKKVIDQVFISLTKDT